MSKLGGLKDLKSRPKANGLQKWEVLESEQPSGLPKESKLYGYTGQGQSDSLRTVNFHPLTTFSNDIVYMI